MRTSTTTLLSAVALYALAVPVFSQQPATGAKVTSSAPGKVTTKTTLTGSARVTAIDRATRKLSLKPAAGEDFDLVVPEEVKSFSQIKVGDEVVIEYTRALTLDVKKSSGPSKRSEQTATARTDPDQRPGAAASRTVTIIADVVEVDPAANLIVLRGPKGETVRLSVQNPEHFKVVKKGDQVEAVYVEALAIAVRQADDGSPGK